MLVATTSIRQQYQLFRILLVHGLENKPFVALAWSSISCARQFHFSCICLCLHVSMSSIQLHLYFPPPFANLLPTFRDGVKAIYGRDEQIGKSKTRNIVKLVVVQGQSFSLSRIKASLAVIHLYEEMPWNWQKPSCIHCGGQHSCYYNVDRSCLFYETSSKVLDQLHSCVSLLTLPVQTWIKEKGISRLLGNIILANS